MYASYVHKCWVLKHIIRPSILELPIQGQLTSDLDETLFLYHFKSSRVIWIKRWIYLNLIRLTKVCRHQMSSIKYFRVPNLSTLVSHDLWMNKMSRESNLQFKKLVLCKEVYRWYPLKVYLLNYFNRMLHV